MGNMRLRHPGKLLSPSCAWRAIHLSGISFTFNEGIPDTNPHCPRQALGSGKFRDDVLGLALLLNLLTSPISAITIHQENGKTVLSLTSEECLNLNINAGSQEDVDYVGGVDVDGNAVAPANLPSSPQIKTPQYVSIPIEPRLDKYLGANNPIVNEFARKAYAGNVVVNLKDNKAYYNGQPLFDVPSALLERACRGHMSPQVSSNDDDSVGETVGSF